MQRLVTLLATWTVLFMLSLWTPADAAAVQKTQAAKSAVTTTDLSARRYYRRYYGHRYYRPYYGYGPGPYYGYGYGYRPYYRPYYAAPFPFFGFPFF
jgi:hypothetical protein